MSTHSNYSDCIHLMEKTKTGQNYDFSKNKLKLLKLSSCMRNYFNLKKKIFMLIEIG